MKGIKNTKDVKEKSKLREDYEKVLEMKKALDQTLNELSKKIKDSDEIKTEEKVKIEVVKTEVKAEKKPSKNIKKEKPNAPLPAGWKLRKSGQVVSPSGQAYKSRYVAVLDMIKRKCPPREIEGMKQKMIEFEDWETSEYLPEGWMYKTIWEGFNSNKVYQYKCCFLSKEGQSFDTMKKVIEYLGNSDEYSLQDAAKCQDFLEAKRKVKHQNENDWQPSDSVPFGWMVGTNVEGKSKFILSPSGKEYKSRVEAFQQLISNPSSREEALELKQKAIDHEAWKISEYLPKGWLYKIIWEGFSKGIYQYNARFVSKEGQSFDTMRKAISHIKNCKQYSQDDLELCQKFLREQTKVKHQKENDWQPSDSVPLGWKVGVSQEGESRFILSPSGKEYKSRLDAFQDLIKNPLSSREALEMKQKAIEHEAWAISEHLPEGWLYKIIWEGFSKGTYQYNARFISREGECFDSMKKATDFIKSSKQYSEDDVKLCKQFLKDKTKVKHEKENDWQPSDSVPFGWKVGINKEGKSKYIISPSGKQYKSRMEAFQEMVGDTYQFSKQDTMEMKAKMIAFENWEFSEHLPEGWLFKCVWDGGLKSSSKIHFLSSEGMLFENMKEVMTFMESQSSNYNFEDVENCKEFYRQRNRETIGERFSWEPTDSLPKGWQIRKSESKSEQEFILSPYGIQYRSRFSAIQDMIKKSDVFNQETVQTMRKMMVEHEGWEENELLPKNWLMKVIWEGMNKTTGKIQTSLFFLSSEGFYFQSNKTALDYIKSYGYSAQDVANFEAYLQKRRRSSGKFKFDWEEADDSLPEGWFKRKAEGKAEMEFILSPEGEQYRSRSVAYQALCQEKADQEAIDAMRSKLSYEGWETSQLLPQGWVFRKSFEGLDRNNRLITNVLFLSVEGHKFDSVKEATMFMDSMPDYTKGEQDCIRKLQRTLHNESVKNRDDWTEDNKTLPAGWKKRLTGPTKQEIFMRPDGQQFKSRLSAFQSLIKDNYPEDSVTAMRSMLHHEGWRKAELLPSNWLYKKEKVTYNNKTSMDYQVLSSAGTHFLSLRAAAKFMATNISFTQDDRDNFEVFMKQELRGTILNEHDWYTDKSMPDQWKMREGQGKTFYLSPDGVQFSSILTAVQHMVETKHSQDDVNKMRSNLKQEGWETSQDIPDGWQQKITKVHNYYLGRYGEYFANARLALEQIEYDGVYDEGEVALIRARAEAELPTVEEKHKWSEKETLPRGWKVRRSLGSNRKFIDWFLAPDAKQIRGKNSALEHLKALGAGPEDMVKMKTFSYCKKSNPTKQAAPTPTSITELDTSMLLDESSVSSTTLDEECSVSSTTGDDASEEALLDSTIHDKDEVMETLKELTSDVDASNFTDLKSKLDNLHMLLSRKKIKL